MPYLPMANILFLIFSTPLATIVKKRHQISQTYILQWDAMVPMS